MKRMCFSLVLLLMCIMESPAQLASGFYHFKNAATGRYLSINDTNPNNYKPSTGSASINLNGLRTYINFDTVTVSPSCVIYVRVLENGNYDLVGQGTSLQQMAGGGKLTINITPAGGGKYRIFGSGTVSGISASMTLGDRSPSSQDGWVTTTIEETKTWYPLPMNTTDEYLGVRPDVKTKDGTYYGTLYFGFSFRLASPGMEAYYASNVGGTGVTLTKIESEVIPAAVPVVIKCNSSDPKDNKIEPVVGGSEFNGVNWLRGVYCSLTGVAKHRNVTEYDPTSMRVIGLNSNGGLAFVKAKESDLYDKAYLKANKAYLLVGNDAADVMVCGTGTGIKTINREDVIDSGLYSLTGVRIPDGVSPRPGIYIQNGRKVIRR